MLIGIGSLASALLWAVEGRVVLHGQCKRRRKNLNTYHPRQQELTTYKSRHFTTAFVTTKGMAAILVKESMSKESKD